MTLQKDSPIDADPRTTLRSEFGPLTLELDPMTGLPLSLEDETRRVDLRFDVELVVGGSETHPPLGGLNYAGTRSLTNLQRLEGDAAEVLHLDSREYRVTAMVENWQVTWIYTFRDASPRLTLRAEVAPTTASDRLLRNVHFRITAHGLDAQQWRVHAPGNRIRPDLSVEALARPAAVSPPGGLKGSSGVIALEKPGSSPSLLLMWPFPDEEIGDISIVGQEDGLQVRYQSDLAGEPEIGTSLSTTVHLDLLGRSWDQALQEIPDWLDEVGVRKPDSAPTWVAAARIYEVQIGFSTFAGDWRYSPYPTAEDLLEDLDRIQGLGFDTLQIMPQHPFPSYNVFDYQDVSTSWGQIDVLRTIIRTCHERGMHVIFDILLHGVVDKEAVARAADAVRRGPYFERIGEATSPPWKDDGDNYHVAYSRHIIDFEPHWSGGSAERHPLVADHPEWFGRSSDGTIIGMYTKSFDNGHPAWQEYFITSCARLVTDLEIDGFRFDAPTYNYFANWSDRARSHASTSMLGSVPMFRRLRRVLKRINPEVMLYTEPSGVLLRQDMDVTYNYDEQWLFGALLGDGGSADQEAVTARACALWLNERDRALPRGALTAHHIDSHDTFWWGLPGHKWLRELYDVTRTRALMNLFALRPGPYMMFTGGENGIEPALRRALELKSQRPELQAGVAYDFDPANDNVYAAEMRLHEQRSLVFVNLSPQTAFVSGDIARHSDSVRWAAVDLLGDTTFRTMSKKSGAGRHWEISASLQPWTAVLIPLPEGNSERVDDRRPSDLLR